MYQTERERQYQKQKRQRVVVGAVVAGGVGLLALVMVAGIVTESGRGTESKSQGEPQQPIPTLAPTSTVEVIRAAATPSISMSPTATSTLDRGGIVFYLTPTPRPTLTPAEVRAWCSGPCRIDDDQQGSTSVMVAYPPSFYEQCFKIDIPAGFKVAGFTQSDGSYVRGEQDSPVSGTTCSSVVIRDSKPISPELVRTWCPQGPCKAENLFDLPESVMVVGDQTTAPCNTLKVPADVRTFGLSPNPRDPRTSLTNPHTISRDGPFTTTYCQPISFERKP